MSSKNALCGVLAGAALALCIIGAVEHDRINELETERDIYASRLGWYEAQEQPNSIDPLPMPEAPKLDADAMPMQYAGEYFCTAYCCEEYPHICGTGDGITASGQHVQAGVTVASSAEFPFGTVLYIEGVGVRIVQDRGAAVGENCIDVAVDTHENALAWDGYGTHKVWILQGAEQ